LLLTTVITSNLTSTVLVLCQNNRQQIVVTGNIKSKKVKLTVEQTMKAHRESRGIGNVRYIKNNT
jgi:hypothetical protein